MISDEDLSIISESRDSYMGVHLGDMAKELLALRKSHEGWKLVPIEPTTEMLEEIWLDERFKEVAIKRRYQALLAAAPEPE